jgi:manganese oxidase
MRDSARYAGLDSLWRMRLSHYIGVRHYPLVALIGLASLVGGCGSSSSSSATAPSGSAGLVTIFVTNGIFSPNPLTVAVGQQINWKNNDTTAHTATLAGVFDTGSIPPLSAHDDPVTMSATGRYDFHCSLHAGETGSIVVQ